MQNRGAAKIILVWDPYFSKEENIIFEKFTQKLLKDYESQLAVLTAKEIAVDSFNNIIAVIVFSDSARTILAEKISNIDSDKLPIILSIVSQQIDFYSKDIRAFPSAITVGKLLAKAIFKEEGKNENMNILSFFLPKETAKECADAFEHSLKWLYPQIDPNIIICNGKSTEDLIEQYKEKINSKTCVVIYGYDIRYNELLEKLIIQNPKRIISEFNTPDSFTDTPNLSYICFEIPLTGVTLFKRIALTLLDTLYLYIEGIDSNIAIKQQRNELRKLLLDQSRFRRTPLGTFHFTENNDFFCPFYLKRGGKDRVELIEGVDSPSEVAITALSECNKQLEEFTYSTKKDAFHILLSNINSVLKNKLCCDFFCVTSPQINHWYPDNPIDWEFMLELPVLFDDNIFWMENRVLQVSINEYDIEDFASYRIYVNDKEPFVEYLHSNQNTTSSLTIAKCQEMQGIKAALHKGENVKLFTGKLIRMCKKIQHEINYVYFVFLRQEQEKQNSQQHACYCFYTKEKLGIFELTILENIAVIINHAIFEVAYKNELRKEAIKSAKAAIMSRNMSHNLGSHVMFYIKQKLESVSKIVQGGVLKNILIGDLSNNSPCDLSRIKSMLENTKQDESVELPFLVGLGRFINYLQERQDYIATIATDYIPAKSTISFKDFVYDELKPDLRYERHHRGANIDVNGSEPKNLLLDYIAFSEGYKSSDSIELKFGEFNGQNPQEGTPACDDFEELRKFNVAAPGGVVGRQAIFSIVENVIRNAAKHSGRRKDGKLAIVFQLLDKNALSALLKSDKHQLRCKRNESSKEESGKELIEKYERFINDYHILSVKLDMPNDKGSIDRLVEKLGEDYVGDNGLMKDSAKGLKEMRISAAWLRGYSIDTEIAPQEPPVLSVLSEPIEGSANYTLTYILCIPKPRRIAFVVDKVQAKEYLQLNESIRPYGCEVFDVSDSTSKCKIPNYDLVCLCTDQNREEILSKISSRYIDNQETALAQLVGLNDTNDSQKLSKKIDAIYAAWNDEWHKKSFPQDPAKEKKHRLVILDAKARDSRVELKDEYGVLKDNLVVVKSTGDAQSSDYENGVIYSTHYKGLNEQNVNQCPLINAICIESVTGNNSTDRLIRKDDWTQEWRCKHLSAGLSKVAIFDERIFSTFIHSSGLDENMVDTCLDEYYNFPESERKSVNLIRSLQNLLGIVYNEAKKLVNATKNSRDILKKEIIKRAPRNYNVDVAQINHERRIWAYDIRCIKDKDNPRVDIVGYTAPIKDAVGLYDPSNTLDECIASITKQGNNYVIEITGTRIFEDKKGDVFDYISIHQGILDKIYTTFDIKASPDEMFKITNALHRAFSKHSTPIDCKKMLPNFIIHSGRSKPNRDDMPQPQPFVQFAAIDQAVKDCKYTLVELLITAHYEDNNNY